MTWFSTGYVPDTGTLRGTKSLEVIGTILSDVARLLVGCGVPLRGHWALLIVTTKILIAHELRAAVFFCYSIM